MTGEAQSWRKLKSLNMMLSSRLTPKSPRAEKPGIVRDLVRAGVENTVPGGYMGLLSKKKGKDKDKHQKIHTPTQVYHATNHRDAFVSQADPLDISIAQVISALEARGLQFDAPRAKRLLAGRFSGGDPERAINLAIVLRDAEDMILIEPSTRYLLGAENSRGTTCYLDALLFSMFSRSFPIFDALLYHAGRDRASDRLVVNLRVFVNLLRSGYLITNELVDILRNAIADCGWADARSPSQQDTSECFGFIAEMLQMPTLTFKVHIAHGGKEDKQADHKIVQERFLALSVPEPPRGPTRLQPIELVDLIDAHFHTKLEVRRPVARSRSTMTPHSFYRRKSYFGPDANSSNGHPPTYKPEHLAPTNPFAQQVNAQSGGYPEEKKINSRHDREVSMQAWQLFELVPRYSAQDSSARQQDFAKQPPVVAICLKRYYFTPDGTAVINPTPIIIPEFIDFTPFTDRDSTIGKTGRQVRLRLESAVCHRGQHVGSGHYISVSRGTAPNQWLLFDDLAAQRVMQGSFGQLFSIEVPYLLFYQLETVLPIRPNRRLPSIPNFGNTRMGDADRTPPPVIPQQGPPYPLDGNEIYQQTSLPLGGSPPVVPEASKPYRY